LSPFGVAVDGPGDVYVTDYFHTKVLKLAAGATIQTKLPFTGVRGARGVAVDGAGDVYVTDQFTTRVLKLVPGATTHTVLSTSPTLAITEC
jgi:serine/threonine protein kinase, bacterial